MLNVSESKIYEIYKNRLLDLSGKNRMLSYKLNAKSLDMYSIDLFDTDSILKGNSVKVVMSDYVEKRIAIEKKSFDVIYATYEKEKKKYDKAKKEYDVEISDYLKSIDIYNKEKEEYKKQYESYKVRKAAYKKKLQEYELRKQKIIKEGQEIVENSIEVFEEWKEEEPIFKKVKPIEPILKCVEPGKPIFVIERYTKQYEEEFRKLLKRVNKIELDTKNYMRDTGNKSLYLSYYFLSGNLKGDNIIKIYAPLFLIPVNLQLNNNSFQVKISNEEILVNRTLLIAIMKVIGKTVSLSSFEYNKLTEEDINSFINKLEELDIEIERMTNQEKFPSRVNHNAKDKFTLHNHLVLGNLVVANSIYDDYEKLGDETNFSVSNLISNDFIRDVDIEEVNKEYYNLNLAHKEISMITKLDTSQELAVYMAKKSNNLVIYGPPGTGKSETILNIISDSLANNKKVLVVSEKKTAIDVLYNRLGLLQKLSLILDTSSLRLNDLKTQINNSMGSIIEVSKTKDITTVLEEIDECYNYFDNVYNILNKEYKGRTISEWYSHKKEIIDISTIEEERLKFNIVRNKDVKSLFEKDYDAFLGVIDIINNNEKVSIYRKFQEEPRKFDLFLKLLNMDINIQEFIYELLYIIESPYVFNNYYDKYKQNVELEILKIEESKKYENIDYKEAEIRELVKEITNIENKNKDRYSYISGIEELKKQFSNVTPKNYELDIRGNLKNIQDEYGDTIEDLISLYTDTYDIYINERNKFFKKKKVLLDAEYKCNEYRVSILKEIKDITTKIKEEVEINIQQISVLQVNKQEIEDRNNKKRFEKSQIEKELNECKGDIQSSLRGIEEEVGHLPIFWATQTEEWITTAEQAESMLNLLREFTDNRDKLIELVEGNSSILALYNFLSEYNLIESEYTAKLFLKIYVDKHIKNIEKENEKNLREVKKYDSYKDSFSESERNLLNNVILEIYKNIVKQRSNNYSLPDEYLNVERRFLSEKDSKSNKFKVRQFIEAFYDVILNYFPVILSTPNAASKFLPLRKDSFDIVIYDEASQLVIEHAIPTIYRSKKVIVVGDDKQLKPSKFFSGSMDIDEELGLVSDEEVTDMDMLFTPDSISQLSLLDNAKNKYNSVSLLFHYRSRYSELIDFSNALFYKGQLKLAPNVIKSSVNSAIKRIKVEGKWIDNQNIIEAERVVELLKEIFNTRKENETIGIVTFNKKQQECIENLVISECLKDSKFNNIYRKEQNRLEKFEDKSIFIKNIENVQGDERDIIIFSVGYAPNETGKIGLQFGPLSQDGGENRLNVAISRAKKGIYVITSFEPEEINVSETKNNGPKYFKDYLEYVKHISNHDTEMVKTLLNSYNAYNNIIEVKSFDSPFEEQIYKALVDKGYNVDTQIGCFGFKIDMGIYDEEMGRYILGIECDGATYHSSTRVKERDIARQTFLESCGWRIHRIWSTLWWKDNIAVLEKLDERIKEEKHKYMESLKIKKEEKKEWGDNNNTVDIYRYTIEQEDERNKFNTAEFFNTELLNNRLKKDYELLGVVDSLEGYKNVEDIPIYFEGNETDNSIKDYWGYAYYNIEEGVYSVLSLDELSIRPKIDIIETIIHEYLHTLTIVNSYESIYCYNKSFEDKGLIKLLSEIDETKRIIKGKDVKANKISEKLLSLPENEVKRYWKQIVHRKYYNIYDSIGEGITELLAQFYKHLLYKGIKGKNSKFYFLNNNLEQNDYWSEIIKKYKKNAKNYPWSFENIEFNPSYPYNVAVVLTVGLYVDIRKVFKFYLESDFLSLHLYLIENIPNWSKVYFYFRECETDLNKEDFNKILTMLKV